MSFRQKLQEALPKTEPEAKIGKIKFFWKFLFPIGVFGFLLVFIPSQYIFVSLPLRVFVMWMVTKTLCVYSSWVDVHHLDFDVKISKTIYGWKPWLPRWTRYLFYAWTAIGYLIQYFHIFGN